MLKKLKKNVYEKNYVCGFNDQIFVVANLVAR